MSVPPPPPPLSKPEFQRRWHEIHRRTGREPHWLEVDTAHAEWLRAIRRDRKIRLGVMLIGIGLLVIVWVLIQFRDVLFSPNRW